jgi:hypothetical protein
MAVFGFTDTAANQLMSGIDTWKISNVSSAESFRDLGLLKDGKVSVKGISETDTRARSHSYGFILEATAKMLYTNNLTCLKLLSAVSASGALWQKISFIAGGSLEGKWGFTWKFVSDKEFDGARYIEIKASIGQVFATNFDALVAGTYAAGTAAPSGTLATFAPTTMYPGGASTLQFHKTGESAETVGNWRDLKFSIGTKELKRDGQYRQVTSGVEFTLEFDMIQASATELALMDDVATGNGGFVIYLADGTTFTLDAGLSGTEFEFKHDNDSTELAVIHVKGTGVLTLAQFDTALSPDA